ncbi:MAG: hypothetical protein ACRDNL_18620 [Spirillospora sp.]
MARWSGALLALFAVPLTVATHTGRSLGAKVGFAGIFLDAGASGSRSR